MKDQLPMNKQSNLDERILGLLMGMGLGVFLGFFLRDRGNGAHPVQTR